MKFNLNNYKYEFNEEKKELKLKKYKSRLKKYEIIPSKYIDSGKEYKIKLGEDCFRGTNIKKVKIKEGIEEIPKYCFFYSELEEIELPNNLKKIDEKAFCDNEIKEIIIPNNVKDIEYAAFCNCKKLTKIIMSNNIDTIKQSVFYKCNHLEKIYYNGTYEDLNKLDIREENNNIRIVKTIYKEDIDSLYKKGYSSSQINQIHRGYEKGIILSNVNKEIPSDVLRDVINNFKHKDKDLYTTLDILEKDKINLTDLIKVNKILTDKENNYETLTNTLIWRDKNEI